MSTCSPDPRSIDEGLDWFLSHDASGSGMCAQHTWHSLGGDRGCPPAWGCANANAVYDKVKKSGRYWTEPHQGDIAIWKYGSNGHAARVYDEAGTKIVTTNPSSGPSDGTGIEPIGYPSKWGATSSARIFTDTYNGIKCFTSGGGPYVTEHVYRSKCGYGEPAEGTSDTVKELQERLNRISLDGGREIAVTGKYDDDTDAEVRKWQEQVADDLPDEAKKSYLGPSQFALMFPDSIYTLHDDGDPAIASGSGGDGGGGEPGPEPEPEPGPVPEGYLLARLYVGDETHDVLWELASHHETEPAPARRGSKTGAGYQEQ